MPSKQGFVLLMSILVLISGLQPLTTAIGGEAAPTGLKPCPSSPNCVSSSAQDPGQRIAPFALYGTPAETLALLVRAIETFSRATVRQQGTLYLKAEFGTLLGFVDDLEFLVDEARGLVEVRSASRRGYWDLGVNRRRVEALRKAYAEIAAKK
jgi:uncharacterized protein (DUF1499 family)